MNDITKTATADLIAEWEKLHSHLSEYHIDRCRECSHGQRSMNYCVQCENCGSPRLTCKVLSLESEFRKDAIAAELDRRCEGIYVGEDGFPYFGDFKFEGKNGTREPKHDAQWVAPTIQISELRDLLTWLLLKEGGKP